MSREKREKDISAGIRKEIINEKAISDELTRNLDRQKGISAGIRKQIGSEKDISGGLTKELGKQKDISAGIRKKISNEKGLISELQKLSDNNIVLIEAKAENFSKIGIDLLKFLTKKGIKGIILSLNRAYPDLIKLYKQNNIDTDKIFVMDFISKSQNEENEENNVLYVENPQDLTNASVALNNLTDSIPDKKAIIIDSISTLLMNNNPKVLTRFLSYLLGNMRKKQIGSFLISMENERNKEFRNELAQLSDIVLEI